MRTVLSLLALVVPVVLGGCGGCGKEAAFTPTKELLSESIVREGDTWRLQFTSRIEAPVDRVFQTWTAVPERSRELAPDYFLKSEIVSQEGNKKVVDVVGKSDILPPGFKVQDLRLEYTAYPEQKKIVGRTVDFKLADWTMEYTFAPSDDGRATIVTFKQTSKDKAPLIVESLQKGALRETYVRQVQLVNKALGLEGGAAPARPQG